MRKFFTIISIAFLVISCNSKKSNKSGNNGNGELPVKIGIAEIKQYNKTLEYAGTFFAGKEANLGTSMPGKVEKIYFEKGSFVKSGTVIAELSSELLTQALIEYETLKKDFERVSRLKEKGSLSEMEFDHIKAKFEASLAKTEMIKKNTSVIAPFDGIVADYLVEEGENYFFTLSLEPGYSNTSGIVRLMQLNPLKFEINVPENDISKLRLNQKIRVDCEAAGLKGITGTITNISPYLSTTTRTATVEISIANTGYKILPGMYGKAYIDYGTEAGIYLKSGAIYRQPGTPEDFVFVIKNGVAKKVRIDKIKSEGEYVIVEGINAGDTVALEGKNKLVEGSKVKIVR